MCASRGWLLAESLETDVRADMLQLIYDPESGRRLADLVSGQQSDLPKRSRPARPELLALYAFSW